MKLNVPSEKTTMLNYCLTATPQPILNHPQYFDGGAHCILILPHCMSTLNLECISIIDMTCVMLQR